MKYPQLVSTRAVNAISDWLVSRLEQIGVEAPLIYSRLLLSLLHSSVQINDPIEFGNLEKYFSNQKGSKRFPPNDTETIKKFTAIQCLLDAVSTEQEISCIEKLVDELFEKLISLEKQSSEEESSNLLHRQLPKSIKSLDIEDPRKRYYRAFPALSKQMEDSVWLKKRNGNSLTWPSGSSGTSSANMDALNNTAGVKRKNKRRRNHQGLNKGRIGNVRKNSYGGNSSPTWDTDFEGNWEMGTDLIKEFLISQKNRNRSISESDASNFVYEKNSEKRMKPTKKEAIIGEKISNTNEQIRSNMFCTANNLNINSSKARIANNAIMRDVNILNNFMADDNVPYDDMFSFKEFDNLSNINRQLYPDDNSCSDQKSIGLEEQNDFAQFEAKFNSDVEALWNDKGKNDSQVAITAETLRNKKNIDNFWTNYYNHHYNNGYIDDRTLRSLIKGTVEEKSDFYSLPSNFNKLRNSVDRKPGRIDGENDLSSVGVFISDSIWSDNTSAILNNCKEDMCFYSNCWETEKNLQTSDTCDGKDIPNAFNIAKWSECSFETPFTPSSGALHPPVNVEVGSTRNVYKQPPSSVRNKRGLPNNLQSQHQLSQPVSLPDYYESSLCCFVTENNNKVSSSIVPLVVPQLHQPITPPASHSNASTTRTVSLANHSKTSGFVEYSILKSSSTFFKYNQVSKYDRNKNANQSRVAMSLVTPSTSGHGLGQGDTANTTIPTVAPINNSSASSSSPLDDDENLLTSYRTHFRPIKQNYADGYQFDISGSLDKIEFERSESGGLYFESEKYFEYLRVDTFLSDEDASSSSSYSSEDHKQRDAGLSSVQGLHPLKFRMKQTDMQCQTEDVPQKLAKTCADQIIVANKRIINSADNTDSMGNSSDEIDDATDIDCYCHEEVSIDLDKWSMAEIGKKCADNNNTHTLWGMCPACTKENKCVPANRLLKDELTIEADEIMSDLKYMQDLYICSDWENEDDENDTDSELEALKNDDDNESRRYGRRDSFDDHNDNMDNEEQEQMFYNITKLISDLLKPENAKSLANVLNASAGNKSNIFKGIASEDELVDNANQTGTLFDCQKNILWRNGSNNNNEKYVGGLWSNDENIIWKREYKPWGNWPRMSDNKTTTFLEKLNWKHANLADIWKSGSVPEDGEIEMKSPTLSSAEDRLIGKFNPDTNVRSSCSMQCRVIAAPIASSEDQIGSKTVARNANDCHSQNQTSWEISAAKAADLVAQRLYQKKAMNCCAVASQTTLNRPDRKRRHSASQNIGCHGTCSDDNGRIAFEWCVANNRDMSAQIDGCNKVEIMAKWESDASKLSSMINADDSLSLSSLSPKTTIITCKYWTTMDTTLASPYFMDKSSHYDGIGAMAMNPSSILRHVTVVSRPLTR